LPTINGWIESTAITAPANKSYSAIYDTNTVPPTPANFEGQTLFFFPGLEDINDTVSILQPVLIYNVSGWSVANYNCCLSGSIGVSTPIPVSPGDEIVSSITENCKPGTLTCATWNVYSLDTKTHQSTSLLNTPSEGQTFNWAFGAVLEPYNVNVCADYPSKPETYNMIVFDEQFKPVVPKWVVSVGTTAKPQCGYGIDVQPFQNTLKYTSTPFTSVASPSSITLKPGGTATLDITVGGLGSGRSVIVDTGLGDLPMGVSYAYKTIPSGVTGGGVDLTNATVVVTLTASKSACLGTKRIAVTASEISIGSPPITDTVTTTVN
jgi:hypothetical protein